MKKSLIATAALLTLFSASVACAQFSSSASQGADTGANGSGSNDNGGGGTTSEGATSGGR